MLPPDDSGAQPRAAPLVGPALYQLAVFLIDDPMEEGAKRAQQIEGDVAISGQTDATRVAGTWAERLTDAVKVLVFGEPPTFSKGTDFGESLGALFKAAVDERGHLNKKSLDRAYQQLPPAQRQALEAPPSVK